MLWGGRNGKGNEECILFAGPEQRSSGVIFTVTFFHREFSKPLLPVGRAGVLLSEILHLLCKQMVSVKTECQTQELVMKGSELDLGPSVNSISLSVQVIPFPFIL